ncbi:MAG: MBL fold metallo-hydrolase [Promethearchaeota archaeon]
MDIGSIESGKLDIKVLTTNTTLATLLDKENLKGKVKQPGPLGARLLGEHGLSLLFDIKDGDQKKKLLLDAGGANESILYNAKILRLKFKEINTFILSHGHIDHFGGMEKLLPNLKEGCEIIISPEAYLNNVILVPADNNYYSPEELSKNYANLAKQIDNKYSIPLPPFSKKMVNNLVAENKLNLIEAKEPIKLNEGIITSGPIELFNEDESTKGFYLKKDNDTFVKNTFRDENSIYINVKDKGLVVITGCGHAGIVNTIKHGQKLTGVNKIYAVIGGFHEEWNPIETVQRKVNFIKELNPEIICGMHCTGFIFNKLIADHPAHVLGISGTEFRF